MDPTTSEVSASAGGRQDSLADKEASGVAPSASGSRSDLDRDPTRASRGDLTRVFLTLLTIFALMVSSLWVLQPFVGPLIWATMIVVATWPLMLRLERKLWGSRPLATSVMTVSLLVLFFAPLAVAVSTLISSAHEVSRELLRLREVGIPEPPVSVAELPVIGERLAAVWHTVAVSGVAPFVSKLAPYLASGFSWVVAEAAILGKLSVQLLLTVVISAILYLHGETAVRGVRGFALRLAGAQGDRVVVLAGEAIRGVALGIVVTAVVQSVLGGVGIIAAGVPFGAVLTAVMFLLCLAQLGPMLVLLPAVGWLYWKDHTTAATSLLVWALVVGTMDNVLRPWLIKKGVSLPLLLIITGVIGGMLAFGLVGLFIGPVLLAVTYTLLSAWIGDSFPPKSGTNEEISASTAAAEGP